MSNTSGALKYALRRDVDELLHTSVATICRDWAGVICPRCTKGDERST